MTRILHTSDFHLNALRKFRDLYLDRVRHTLSEISNVAIQESVDYIVMAGDIYDRRDILHDERNMFSEWLGSLNIPVIAISGNHDKRTEDIGDTSLSYLSSIQTLHAIVHDGSPRVVEKEDCTFILFPYEKWSDYEFYLLLEYLQSTCVESKPIVVVMHEAISGCKADSGFEVPTHIRLDPSLRSDFPQIDYWALGDMHTCQSIAPNIWYSGAPHQISFGENPGKGVLIVDTDDPTNPKFVEIDSTPLVTVDDIAEDMVWDPEVIYRCRPDHAFYRDNMLPNNVFVSPRSTVVHALKREHMVGLFHNLDETLLRIGLRKDLVPLALRLAKKSAKELHIAIGNENEDAE